MTDAFINTCIVYLRLALMLARVPVKRFGRWRRRRIRRLRRQERQLGREARRRRRRLVRWYKQNKRWLLRSHLVQVVSAAVKRLRYNRVTYIGVTGSCGKTTTVRLIAEVLSTDGPCPRDILSVGSETKYCALELSADARGLIRRWSRTLRPQIGVVTTIGGDHYKVYRSLEATAAEKGLLIGSLPADGTAILNADDPNVSAMAGRTHARFVTFGLHAAADVRAIEVTSVWPNCLKMTVVHGNQSIELQTRLIGEHWVTSVLAAITCGVVCGIELRVSAGAIERLEPVFGRYSVHRTAKGTDYVLDHKAPFWTIANSLSFVGKARASRKTIVFGTISDYSGSGSTRYRRVARQALEVAERVIFVGPNSSHVSRLQQGELRSRLFAFQTTYQAASFLSQNSLPDELVYVKGSTGVDHLERIVLSQLDSVVCWRERCRIHVSCHGCKNYDRPHPPPFGVAELQPMPGRTEPATHQPTKSKASLLLPYSD